MTPIELQRELAEETENILKDVLCKTVSGKVVNVRTFLQELPKRIQNIANDQSISDGQVMPEDGEDEPYPFCVVKIDSGGVEPVEGAYEIRTTLIFGIFDDDVSCQGHQVILTMFQRFMERFAKNPVLNNRYRMNEREGIEWTLDDEDRHPYYLGAMSMSWHAVFVIREEDRYA